MSTHAELLARIRSGDALVGVIGLGYVGLPIVQAMHAGGYRVLGFDIDPAKVRSLAEGRSYLKHISDGVIRSLAESRRFDATSDFGRLGEPDAIIICVPTPLGRHHEPDLTYVRNSGHDIGRCLRQGQLVVLESTSYPGTTRGDLLGAILAARSAQSAELEHGRDFFVAFSPEREDPGRTSHTTRTTPRLVGGLDDASTELAVALYRRAVDHVHPVSSAEVAEAAKVLENVFRAVNIAMVNELKMILSRMDIDVWEVIEAAATKPFGFMPFYPGPGLGGHCIPIDPFYLTWKAREVGQITRFIELAGEINTKMPHYVVDRLTEALNEHGRAVKGSKILVIGLAYKPNVDDTRETPAAEILDIISDLGGQVQYHDPHVPAFPRMRKHAMELRSVPLTKDELSKYDAVVIVTNHDAVDYEAIATHAKLVIDTRNALKNLRGRGAQIVKA